MANESKEVFWLRRRNCFWLAANAGTTVDAICEKAELTKGSFYHFFDSKEDLALAVLE
jgi:TetR/AcrR family transcriptional regulator, transcriptional repressor for nem operon